MICVWRWYALVFFMCEVLEYAEREVYSYYTIPRPQAMGAEGEPLTPPPPIAGPSERWEQLAEPVNRWGVG